MFKKWQIISMQHKISILGVCGGSGSGKTFFANALRNKLSHSAADIIYQDNFYFDQSAKFDFDGGSVNFDHPDAIDADLLAKAITKIKTGLVADIPIYDFSLHKRKQEVIRMNPRQLIIVDGILIFHYPQVRQLFDDLIFFETSEELRFSRRLERDVLERGRTPEGVKNQFIKQVKPMHDQFVEPSKEFAKYIVKDIGHYEDTLEHFFRKYNEKQ